MKLTRSRGLALLVVVALASLLVGGVAAALPEPKDHSPFTMTVAHWNAALGSEAPGAPVAGTVVTRLEYQNVRDWKSTVVSHSVDRAYEGSTHVVKDDARDFFDALTRRAFARVARGEAPEVPDRWLIPGLIDDLPGRGFSASAGSVAGTVVFTRRESATVVSRQGHATTNDLLTRAVFSQETRLPLSVEEFVNGSLATSTTYTVVSRP